MAKRVLCLILALTVVLALAAPALADGDRPSASRSGVTRPKAEDEVVHIHSWDGGVVTKSPNYLRSGLMTYTCTICGEVQEEELPRLEPVLLVRGASISPQWVRTAMTLRETMANILESAIADGSGSGITKATASAIRAALTVSRAEDRVTVAAELSVTDGIEPARIDAVVDAAMTEEGLVDVELLETALQTAKDEAPGQWDDDQWQKAAAIAAAIRQTGMIGQVEQFVDIDLSVVVNGANAGEISTATAPIGMALPLPEGSDAPFVYVVDSSGDILPSTVEDGKVLFDAERFSTFALVSSNDIANATVETIPAQVYTGEEIRPQVTVTVQGINGLETLRENVDFTVSYENNIDTGAASVAITGIGRFAGVNGTVFAIKSPDAGESGPAAPGPAAPDTGNETPVALYAGVLVLCLAGLWLVLRRRNAAR